MSCIQVTACKPGISHSHFKSSALFVAPVKVFQIPKDSAYHFTMLIVSLRPAASCQIQQCTLVCLFGGKGKSANGDEMEKQEYYDDGGSGGKRPGGGGSGSGGSEDEGPFWDLE